MEASHLSPLKQDEDVTSAGINHEADLGYQKVSRTTVERSYDPCSRKRKLLTQYQNEQEMSERTESMQFQNSDCAHITYSISSTPSECNDKRKDNSLSCETNTSGTESEHGNMNLEVYKEGGVPDNFANTAKQLHQEQGIGSQPPQNPSTPGVVRHVDGEDKHTAVNTSSEQSDKKPNPLISETEKCQVCNAPAAKHVHYGAITCFSCRAFFRRSIQMDMSQAYSCRGQHNCPINPNTRKGCQKCRYDKCIKIGMNPGWVLTADQKSKEV